MENKETSLSDKLRYGNESIVNVYPESDVKYHVKLLMEDCKEAYTPSLYGELLVKINKIFGDELTK